MHAVVATGGRPRSSWEAAREKTNPQAAGGQDVDLPAPRGGVREGRRPNQVPRTTGCEVADQRTPKEDTKRARRELKKQTALLLREGRGRAGEKEAETQLSPNGTRGGLTILREKGSTFLSTLFATPPPCTSRSANELRLRTPLLSL